MRRSLASVKHVAARRLAAVDAQMYWMSEAVPNDQFLLYAFDGCGGDLDQAIAAVRRRAQACADLGLCVADTGFWTYPVWAPCRVGAEQIVVHDVAGTTWAECLSTVAGLVAAQLDARAMTWRLHVFPVVEGVPRCSGAGRVVVMQICHALGDGIRSSALAAYLLGRDGGLPAVAATRATAVMLPARGFVAARAHRRLGRDTRAGLVPAQADSRPLLRSNQRPDGPRHLRTVVVGRDRVAHPTVTVAVLAAISGALSGYLRALGEDASQLGVEVPMARSGPREAYNHFSNVGVGLYPGEAAEGRVHAIAADLHQRRRRAAHPAMRTEAAASAAVPAPLLRWGVSKFDPEVRWETVTGNTVVSSVNRGGKDLRFGEAPVVVTAGFPGLSPMMGVTHGVHGIGDTIAVSVHAAESAMDDIESYVERLEYELR